MNVYVYGDDTSLDIRTLVSDSIPHTQKPIEV